MAPLKVYIFMAHLMVFSGAAKSFTRATIQAYTLLLGVFFVLNFGTYN